jgi:hypothetical protein
MEMKNVQLKLQTLNYYNWHNYEEASVYLDYVGGHFTGLLHNGRQQIDRRSSLCLESGVHAICLNDIQ